MGISDYLSHFLELPEVTLPKFFPIIRPILPRPKTKHHEDRTELLRALSAEVRTCPWRIASLRPNSWV